MLQLLELARENAALTREFARIRGEAEQVEAMAEALELSGLVGPLPATLDHRSVSPRPGRRDPVAGGTSS